MASQAPCFRYKINVALGKEQAYEDHLSAMEVPTPAVAVTFFTAGASTRIFQILLSTRLLTPAFVTGGKSSALKKTSYPSFRM